MTLTPEVMSGIAVIGYSGRFPGAGDVETFWSNIRNGVESITTFGREELLAAGTDPALLAQPNYVRAAAVLDDVESFDAAFFGYSPREAEIMDPQQRIFLETAHAALENAGYDPRRFAGRIGVYAGAGMNTYLLHNLMTQPELLERVGAYQALIGSDKDFLATRVSYKLNLRGPSISIQTACSTSLVAVATACQSLMNAECEMALAGGVTVRVPQRAGYLYQEEGILSPDGHCRPFDDAARGTVPGSGAGVVVLKRLADAIGDRDTIHAVIRGWAVNNDGSQKAGFTAPSVDGQSEAVVEAMALAEVEPSTIQYLEAHGTGTHLGDPIEMRALARAFASPSHARRTCAIGSVKSNVGHLDGAAGVAGLIKTVLALEHRELPPALHFEKPNREIDFDSTPFYVNTAAREWIANGQPRRAGVSSFGIGGTNAHVVVEEAPAVRRSDVAPSHALLVFSARSEEALDSLKARFDEFVGKNPDVSLHDAAYTLQVGRTAHPLRRAVVLECGSKAAAFESGGKAAALQTAFLFPGQGSQYANMAAELYDTYSVFREEVDRCVAILGIDIRSATQEELEQTAITQPALFTIEYALAKLWMSLGVQPEAMLGHSVGEYVAACLSGVFSLEDALRLVARRGALIQQLEKGAMIAVPLPERDLLPLVNENIAIAAVNAPSLCVVSGRKDAIESLERVLGDRGVVTRRLHTSHAFHSPMMDVVLEPFRREVEGVALRPPRIPFISNVTGTWITAEQACDPGYWTSHVRNAVRFAGGVTTLLENADRMFVEVGPGQTLTSFVRQHAEARQRTVLTSMRHPQDEVSDVATFLRAVGGAWVAGVDIDWQALHRSHGRSRIPLPAYPFERTRHWIEPNLDRTRKRGAIYKRDDAKQWFYVPSWKRTAPATPAAEKRTFECFDEKIADALRARGASVGSEAATDVVLLADDVAGVASVVRKLAQQARGTRVRLTLITRNLRDVTGGEPIDPERAAVSGLSRVIAQEHPNLSCRVVDFDSIDAALCANELLSDANEPVVAYRGGHRWIETFEATVPRQSASLPSGAHVVVTGGLGRFGLAVAKHLGSKCKVTLIDRKPSDRHDAIVADVTSRDQMRAALDEARRRSGPIDVVIHAAGATDGVYQTLSDASADDFTRHMRPKLEGLRVLDELLGDEPPRVALVTSSLASILGGITLGPYAAADAAADAFALRSRLWTSVNFEGWEDLDAAIGKQQSELMLKENEIVEALDRAMSFEGLRQLIVSTGDLEARIEQWTHVLDHSAPVSAPVRSSEAASYRAPSRDIEIKVAAIWHEALGVEPIGLDDDFFELGGNSLIGLQILSRLRAEFQVELPLRSFFEARTVEGMVRAIEAETSTGAEERSRIEAILGEIESLTDEEIEEQLQAEAQPHVCRGMRFSIFFFSADGSAATGGKYDLLLECARFADAHDFDAVWTPERHFVDFGGLYPNPAVLSAALAKVTQRIQIRAGSVVFPLHHPIRIAEEWAVVDNLSNGRVAVSCATGWHPDDFLLAPERYASRRELMFRGMTDVRRLWAGEAVTFRGVDGKDVEVRTFPRPVQRELPMWVTSSGNVETWVRAGECGANVLASMGSQPLDDLAEKVRRYRDARRRAGLDPASGVVTLMLHTFVGTDDGQVRLKVRAPLSEYLQTHMQQRDSFVQIDGITAADKRALTEMAFEHYFEHASLLGTPEKCSRTIEQLERAGVDEVACLVDFGVDTESVLGGLPLLDIVRRQHECHSERSEDSPAGGRSLANARDDMNQEAR